MSLTPKQEKFCQCIVSGMSAKDSYRTAYNTKANDKTVYTESTKILAREDVTKRLEELRKPLENQARTTAISEREKKRSWLWNMIENESVSESDRLRAMDLLNKMDAEYININRNIEEKTDISKLDISALEKLVNNN